LRYNFIAMKKIIAPILIIALILAHMVLRLVSADAFILHDRSESRQEMAAHGISYPESQRASDISPYRPSVGLNVINY